MQVKIEKNRGDTMTGNMGATSTLWYICDGAHSEGGTITAHLIQCRMTQSSSVGEIGNYLTIKIHPYQGWYQLTFLKKNKKRIDEEKEGKQKKRVSEKKEKKKERKKEGIYIKGE